MTHDYKVTVALGAKPGVYDCSVYIRGGNYHIGQATKTDAAHCEFIARAIGVSESAPSFHATCIWRVRDALETWFVGEPEEWDIMVKAGGITLI